MEESRSSPATVRFACFELNQYAGELRKEDGKCIRLREQFRRRVWPSDTFADFDQRHQQRYPAPSGERWAILPPRYIETLARPGYRFIGRTETGTSSAANRIQSLAVLPLENLSRDPDQELYI